MRLNNLIKIIESLAPLHLAEAWDKVGLHVGDPIQNIRRATLCIDLTMPVLAEAIADKSQLVIAYHPPIFKPIDRLTAGPWKADILRLAIQKNIAIYSPHTALDAARGGPNDWLASSLEPIAQSVPITPHTSADPSDDETTLYKVAVFTPRDDADTIRNAMADAGAGHLGNYRECSFNIDGVGTFRGLPDSNPAIGKPGTLERVDETRVEMIVPAPHLARVLNAIRKAHRYEEPAIDVYKLTPPTFSPATSPTFFSASSNASSDLNMATGAGRLITLAKPITPTTLANRLKKHLKLKHLKITPTKKPIRTIALCVGAGGSLFESPNASHADAYVTGEMQHHQALDLAQQHKTVILAGHTNTERPYLPTYRKNLTRKTGTAIHWSIAKSDRSPCQII